MPEVVKLSGEPTLAQPSSSDTALSLRTTLAQELGTTLERVWLVNNLAILGFRLVHKALLLEELGDVRLQVLILPSREVAIQLILQQALLPEVGVDDLIDHISGVALESLDDLDLTIQLIFRSSLGKPDLCEKYADLACSLKACCCQASPLANSDGSRAFTRALLNTCQDEFDSVLGLSDKNTLSAWVRLLGTFFLRKLIRRVQVVTLVVDSLIGAEESGPEQRPPEEHNIKCVCELLRAIGASLDATPQGKQATSRYLARLVSLKRLGGLSDSLRIQIEHLVNLREFNWAPCS